MSNPRVRKIADRIQVIVAQMLERRVKDPRLGFVTVTDVRVSGDTQQASVFYTAMSDDPTTLAATAAALESAKGLIRSEVAKQLGMRHAPSLEFVHDALPETARHLDEVLARAKAQDEAVAAARGTTYAGDEDPYRKPRELDEDDWDEDVEDDE
jgi:ribosome-binding factor A